MFVLCCVAKDSLSKKLKNVDLEKKWADAIPGITKFNSQLIYEKHFKDHNKKRSDSKRQSW